MECLLENWVLPKTHMWWRIDGNFKSGTEAHVVELTRGHLNVLQQWRAREQKQTIELSEGGR